LLEGIFNIARVIIFSFIFILFSCVSNPINKNENKIPLIIIDPGHGGSNNGAVATYQKDDEVITFREKDITLKIAQLLYARLKNNVPKAKIILTRNDDINISLEDRVLILNQIINDNYNAVFVSIHINDSPNKEASGIEVYYHFPALIDPEAIISAQYLKEVLQKNTPFAETILNAVESIAEQEGLTRGMKSGDYYVLRNAKAPAVLIECGFISNEREAFLLNSDSYQEKLAKGIALGIENYLKAKRN